MTFELVSFPPIAQWKQIDEHDYDSFLITSINGYTAGLLSHLLHGMIPRHPKQVITSVCSSIRASIDLTTSANATLSIQFPVRLSFLLTSWHLVPYEIIVSPDVVPSDLEVPTALHHGHHSYTGHSLSQFISQAHILAIHHVFLLSVDS